MALSDISLTSGMRNNLVSLQKTAAQLASTQDKLSSGKRVNSALDNPTNFFAAQSHLERASDFSDRKDGMSEAVQTFKAADNGIKAITALINSAKGLAASAIASNDATTQGDYLAQYTEIQAQINSLATDSAYKGTNLLASGVTLKIEFSDKTDVAFLEVDGVDSSSAAGLGLSTTGAWTSADAAVDLKSMDDALNKLRSTSSTLASNLSIVTARQDFTNNMINTLQSGADNLTLADMNQEGANMLMLQTRQSLGTTALSLSSQAAQSVLRLF